MIRIFRTLALLFSLFFVSMVGMGIGQLLTQKASGKGALPLPSDPSSSSALNLGAHEDGERYELLELFNRVLHFVMANYVEEIKIKTLIEGAIKGMLETLDPHSSFLPADLYKEMQIDTSGKFGGLGIEIQMRDKILTIVSPIEDTPAWKAGLKSNDRIIKINKESTQGMSLIEAVSKMRGKANTKVTLTIYREGVDHVLTFTINREIIKVKSVKFETVEPHYGYARLTTFNENAAQDLKKAIESMGQKDKLKGLILDLRGNPGGLLDQAVEVASLFLDDGVIVSTIGRNHDQKDVKYAHSGMAIFKDLPTVVLVNSTTASAAEIVAGALQDHKRALVLGQPTFGKGSVQTVIPLGADKGLKLTVARYYTPSGKSIQEKGVIPDISLDEFDAKALASARLKGDYTFREKDLRGHMINTDEGGDGEKEDAEKEVKANEREEFKKEQLDALAKNPKSSKDKDKEKEKEKEDDMTPYRINPKEDQQVKECLIALKSQEIRVKESTSDKAGNEHTQSPKKKKKEE